MSSPVYFITGATGFIGRQLCRQLRAAGHPVRALARRPDADLAALGVEVIQGDLAKPGPWQQQVAGVGYVIHCAANPSFTASGSEAAINIESTRLLLAAARAAGGSLRRFVFISTIGAVDRPAGDACAAPLDMQSPHVPSSAYGRSKAAAEKLVRDSGLPYAIVRPAMVVGGAMRYDSHFAVFTRMALRGSLISRLAWPGALSVVHVDDVAAAIAVTATHPDAANQTFFCAGEPFALRDCFQLACPATRLPMGWLALPTRIFPWLFPFQAKVLLRPALVASDAPLRALGWVPRHASAAALEAVIVRERARIDPYADPGGQTIITGAASGLGLALTNQLAPRRRQVLLVDRNAEALAAVQQAHPHCRMAVTDLSDEAGLQRLVNCDAWRAFPVSEIYACAGIGFRGAMLDIPAEKHARLFKVNVLARLFLAHAALPGMIRGGFGRMLFVSSSSAFQPLPFMASYAASNAALLLLGEAWGAEVAGTGVQMLQICPGGMQTNFHRAAGVRVIESERLMTPAEVADRIMAAMKRRRVTIIISIRAIGMSLVARVLPRAVSVRLWKRLMEVLR